MKIKSLGDLEESQVEVIGRLTNIRNHKGGLYFVQLEDHTGEVQCVIENPPYKLPKKQSVIKIKGNLVDNSIVQKGIPGKEIKVAEFSELSPCYENPRFEPSNIPKSRRIGLENRHIMLRNPEIRSVFKKKSNILRDVRNYFGERDFTEVESPGIVGDNVEGSVSAFQVDYFGKKAHLSISNMLYHHILISGDFENIFEVGKLFRQDKLNSSQLLNEFLILDYTLANKSREEVMDFTEGLVKLLVGNMEERGESPAVRVPETIPVITYGDLLKNLNQQGYSVKWGENRTLGKKYTEDLRSKFGSFFWIIDQPEESKSFFTSSREDRYGRRVCNDFQLWHPDYADIADGSERVIDSKIALEKIVSKGLNPNNYQYYLSALNSGLYPCTGVGMGMNKLAMALIGCDNVRDVVLFPRDQRTLEP